MSTEDTCRRITPSGSIFGEVLSEQDRIAAKAIMPAEHDLKRLKNGVAKGVERRIVTL
jgi:hypothetical protein